MAMPKVSIVLARLSPMHAVTEHAKSRPMGESLSVRSIKWAQKRRPNMMAEVQMNKYLPCSEVKRLPVMF